MDENRESHELAIPGKIVKRNTGITSRVRNILRKPAAQAITKPPQAIEKTPQTTEQTPGEMSVERARKILERVVDLHEDDLDIHERNLTPAEQFKRFGGGPYKDEVKKAFSVYTDHLVTTHGAKKPSESYSYELSKEDLPGPPQKDLFGVLKTPYFDLELELLLDFERRTPKAVQLTLNNETRYRSVGPRVVHSRIPLVDVGPGSQDEEKGGFFDRLSVSRPFDPKLELSGQEASLGQLRMFSENKYNDDPEQFHREYKLLHRGMRWTAANLLHWDEDKIVYPDDLDKPPFDKGQAQLNKPKLELPPKQ